MQSWHQSDAERAQQSDERSPSATGATAGELGGIPGDAPAE
jgi:hypothetical protein